MKPEPVAFRVGDRIFCSLYSAGQYASEMKLTIEPLYLGAANSPVIPDGWVACSERMPHKDGMYIAFDGHRVITAPRMWNHWQVNQLIEVNITHWMPLPAAPKPEK